MVGSHEVPCAHGCHRASEQRRSDPYPGPTFFVPGTQEPALVRGFGAVYTDVDTEHTAFEYFAADGTSLGSYAVPLSDRGLSFLGVAFAEPIVARVRIEYGTEALGGDNGTDTDVAVMDDFIFGEPRAIEG